MLGDLWRNRWPEHPVMGHLQADTTFGRVRYSCRHAAFAVPLIHGNTIIFLRCCVLRTLRPEV
jgi:hypothetical protein